MFRLDQKIALITGAASGIGASTARAYTNAGATVYLADRDAESGEQTAASLAAEGSVTFLPLDVTDEEACRRAAATVISAHGRLDVLVNNAGVGHVGTMLETTGEDLDRLYAVNVRGVFNVSKAFLPAMVKQRSGVILNLASIGGVVGIRDRLAYCATKFAVVGLSKSMALDHAAQGIRVNCICPGRVETPFVQARLSEYADAAAARREMESTQALKRMARPDEIAAAALYLASDEAAFITGSEFIIDGGWSAGK
jgi:NAD(P)-dependent dehydrogenase (short-subunit alcohol dehydrogenase family)